MSCGKQSKFIEFSYHVHDGLLTSAAAANMFRNRRQFVLQKVLRHHVNVNMGLQLVLLGALNHHQPHFAQPWQGLWFFFDPSRSIVVAV